MDVGGGEGEEGGVEALQLLEVEGEEEREGKERTPRRHLEVGGGGGWVGGGGGGSGGWGCGGMGG